MATNRHFNLTKDNKHLLDIFSDDCYLELGNISNSILNKLLKKKLVRYSDLTYFDIQNKGIGSSNISFEELDKKIPFIYFENLHHKKPSRQLFISHGVLVQKRGYKEYFTPIILIPVNMFFKDNEIWFQMIDRPIENPYLPSYRKSVEFSYEKLNSAYKLDECCINTFKQETQNLRFENYLTFAEVSLADRLFFNDKFSLDGPNINNVYSGYNIDGEKKVSFFTPLNRSQRSALEIASYGNSFAITGSLGTGKTTTLANIAFNAINDGKKVLYVSNNTETLKEVKTLFRKNDLDYLLSDFTNPLHEDELDEINYESKGIIDNIIKGELQTKYDGIKEYTKLLYEKINGFYFLDVMKGLIEFKDVNKVFNSNELKGIDSLYKLEVLEIYKALKLIDKYLEKIDSYKNSKFNNIPIKNNSNDKEIFNLLSDLFSNYELLLEKKNILENDFGFADISNYAYFRNMINNYKQLDKNLIPKSWLEYKVSDCKTKNLVNFQEAKLTFQNFAKEMNDEKAKELILENEYDVIKLRDIDIHHSINLLLSRFKDKDIEDINKFLKNINMLCDKLLKLKNTINECEYNFGKLRDKIGIKVNYRDVDTIEELVPMILYFGSHKVPKVWLDLKNIDGVRKKIINIEKKLSKYESLVPIYNQYFNDINNIENNLIYLKKKSEKNDKYHNMNIKELIEKISELNDLHKQIDILNSDYYALTLHSFDKNNKLVDEFDNFISLVNGIKNENVRTKIVKNLNSLKDIALEEFIKPFIIFSTTYLEIKKEYQSLIEFDLVKEEKLLPKITSNVSECLEYCLNVQSIQNKLAAIIKRNLTYVPYQEYILLAQKIEDLEIIRHKIDNNKDYMFLFGSMFKGYQSDIDMIEKYLYSFALYTNIFKDNDSLNASLNKENCEVLNLLLSDSFSICEKVNEHLKDYSKIFRDSVGKFYYESLELLITYLRDLIDSRDELIVYLNITKGMQLLIEHKLYNFNELIIENGKDKYADSFMLSYYKYLYDKFVSLNPSIVNNEGYYKLLDDIMVREKKIIESNIANLKNSKPKRSINANFRNQDYMAYINKLNDYKYLYLSDSQTVNLYLDVEYFDLVLLDDASLLNAEHYYKLLNCKQIIIASFNDVSVSIAKDIVSKLKKSSIIEFKHRYVTTPISLLKNLSRASGEFYSSECDDAIVFENRDFSDFVCDLLVKKNDSGELYIDKSIRINYFVRSLAKIRSIYDDVCKKLVNLFSLKDIFYALLKQINISDVNHPYVINSDYNIFELDDYANELDVYRINNILNLIVCVKKKLIIIDKKSLLESDKSEGIVSNIKNLDKANDIVCEIKDSVVKMIEKSLTSRKVKVLGKYNNYDLLVKKNNKMYGITIFNAPTNYGIDILNIYRDNYNSSFPNKLVFLNEFVEKYDETIYKLLEAFKDEGK